MKNFVQPGDVIEIKAAAALTSGDGVKLGALFGVATKTVLINEQVNVQVTGVVDIAKVSAQAWVAGDRIYWDDTAKKADKTATVGQLIGVATAAAANPSSTGKVRLNSAVPDLDEGEQAALTVQKTTITHTAPGTEDFAIQSVTSTSPFGFVTADEGNTVLLVIANLQTRLSELETRLKAQNIIA